MFYSQFILAKKGPLGTIWIAAHLERKLRKNQVADTDIGVSVDSILFPDVPIALRLSSHLLLGVVRIYNRKVNYLFDDCSEALLKVKQAFRSTTVDLPPEESKAPYNSITLPETFDLDDFELPDNDIFQGNYVDHHISSREQITLQDTMEGVSYSTSKFGLDERFGDGDASGLDLDEELLLDKIDNAEHADGSADPQASVRSMSPLKQEEHPEDRAADLEITVDDGDTDLMDYDQAPRTPGLVEEPNLSNVQEASACDDHMESEYHLESTTKGNTLDMSYDDKQEVDWCSPDAAVSDAVPQGLTGENVHQSGVLEVIELRPQEESPIEGKIESVAQKEAPSISESITDLSVQVKATLASELSDNVTRVSDVPFPEDLQNGAINKEKTHVITGIDTCVDPQDPNVIGLEEGPQLSGIISTCQQVPEGVSAEDVSLLAAEVSGNLENATTEQKSCPETLELASENQVGSFQQNPEIQDFHETVDSSAVNLGAHEKEASNEMPFLKPCNSILEQSEITKLGSSELMNAGAQSDVAALASSEKEANLGKEYCTTGTEQELKDYQVQEPVSGEIYHPMSSITDGQVNTTPSQDELVKNVDNHVEAELSAPEKVLAAEGPADLSREMLVEVSPMGFEGLDEGDSGSKTVAGKKRSFTGSTLTEQSMYSVESSRVVRFKRTTESVPDDDDLLSSILVGRRSSALKVKPTPVSEVTSMKRTRSAPRSSAPKRKILMDDTMVLHGDTIRQQLTNTEDIRRVRKKAPCTYPEISVIQKQHSEDEIFLEAVFTGLSVELASLHSQVYDLSRISVYQNDAAGSSHEIVVEPSLASHDNQNDETQGELNLASQYDNSDATLETFPEPHLTSQNNEIGANHDIENYKGLENTDATGKSSTDVNSEVLPTIDSDILDPSEIPHQSKNGLDEVDHTNIEVNVSEEQIKPINDMGPDDSRHEPLLDVAEVETSPLHTGVSDPAVIAELDGNSSHVAGDASADMVQKTEAPSIELDSANAGDGQRIGGDEETEKVGDVNGEGKTEFGAGDDFLSDVAQDATAVELVPNAEHGDMEYCLQNEMNNVTAEEQHIGEFVYPANTSMVEDHSMNNGESADHMEAYQPNLVDAETSNFGQQERDELDYSATAVDTEFLNVDDDELNEMADEYTPDAEETRFMENSGWSSRTRAVSKYLQTAFVKEAECGRKSLSMNRLLIGKSRKEASRMFFETLVLKTRDYVHVEQPNAFEDITMKPRTKLIKSDF